MTTTWTGSPCWFNATAKLRQFDAYITQVMLPGMTHRVGRKGQVVIPEPLRAAVGLEVGDPVAFSLEGNAIRVERVVSADALMGRLAAHRLVRALEQDRRDLSRR